jgi:hypothetical protein
VGAGLVEQAGRARCLYFLGKGRGTVIEGITSNRCKCRLGPIMGIAAQLVGKACSFKSRTQHTLGKFHLAEAKALPEGAPHS